MTEKRFIVTPGSGEGSRPQSREQQMMSRHVKINMETPKEKRHNPKTSRKVIFIICMYSLISLIMLGVVLFSTQVFNGVRSYVRGEGLWAKAQSEAVFHLYEYTYSKNHKDYESFLDALSVTQGDMRARIALSQPGPETQEAYEGFLQGGNDPKDIDAMIWSFLYFQDISFMRDAITIWTKADKVIAELIEFGEEINQAARKDDVTSSIMDGYRKRLRQLNEQLQRFEIEFSSVLSDGARWISRVILIGSIVLVITFVGIGHLVSLQIVRGISRSEGELADSEARYRMILDTMVDTYYRTNNDGRLTMVSPSVIELLGYSPDELIGTPLSNLYVNPSDRKSFLKKLCSSGGKMSSVRSRLKNKDGEDIWVSTSAQFLYDRSGSVAGVEGITRDISEQVKIERELIDTKHATEVANKAKSEFLASMSHELRTPLNAVLGFAQMLQISAQSKEQREQIEHILSGGYHLLKLVNEILNLARIESGELDLKLEDVSLNDCASECVALLTPLAERNNVKIISHVEPRLPIHVYVDRFRLKQILINLLSNAIKFNKSGGTVAIDQSEPRDGIVRLTVSDTGKGIARTEFDNIFMKFYRTNINSGISQEEGAGIGLAVCKLLVEGMSGKIGVNSQPGIGSEFWIELPLFAPQYTMS